MIFFDSLVHATPDGRWLGATRYDASLQRLLSEMNQSGVDRACLVAIADHIDNDYVARVAQLHPDRFVPIASLNPCSASSLPAVAEAVDELHQRGFAGIKLHPRLNQYDPLDPRCLEAIGAAGNHHLVVFIDTLFRQPAQPTRSTPDIVDQIATRCRDTRMVLLHAGGPAMLELFELGRMHSHLLLDLSFTLLRYAGSSVDLDIRFMCQNLDQRVTIGSDFPEYVPSQAMNRILELSEGIPKAKMDNVLYRNLSNLFATWNGISG